MSPKPEEIAPDYSALSTQHSALATQHSPLVTFLQKRWFLCLLVLGGLVVWLRPEWLRWTAWLNPQIVVGSGLFLLAWGLESQNLYRTLLRPWPALWAVLISYGFVPALGWLIGPAIPSDDFRIGLMVIASVPCTLVSAAIWTQMAKGNEATALLTIFLTTCTSWLATTTWLAFAVGATVSLDTTGMMSNLVLVLILPVVLGQSLRAVPALARSAGRYRGFLSIVSRVCVLLIILKAATGAAEKLRGRPESVSPWLFLMVAGICLGIHLLALGGGLWSGRAFRFSRPDRIAVAFAGSQKTLPVALVLFDAYFQNYPLAVFPLVFYHVGQLLVDTFIAEEMARRSKP